MTHIANDWTPQSPRPLTAVEEAMKLVDWAVARLHERGSLWRDADREAKAQEYEAAAARCHAANDLAGAGRYHTAARIMRASL